MTEGIQRRLDACYRAFELPADDFEAGLIRGLLLALADINGTSVDIEAADSTLRQSRTALGTRRRGSVMNEQLAYPRCPLCSWPATDCTCEDEGEGMDDERTHIGPWT